LYSHLGFAVTAQDIQSLIAEIDSVLVGENAGTSRSQFASRTAHHNILEKVRSYLVSLREQGKAPPPSGLRSPVSPRNPEEVNSDRLAEAIASAVVEKLDFQRAVWMQPWQMELETARQERSNLLREIQQLEGQRQQLLGDFLQVLLGRVSENLKQEISQTLEKIETQFIYSRDGNEAQTALPHSPTQRLEQLQQLQVQSDRLLMSLDRTFLHVFETLEKDLQGYEESLSAAIARMYELGRQGESILTDRLRESPPQEENPSQPVSREELTPSEEIPLQPLELGTSELPFSLQTASLSPPLYPFPGIELPPAEPEAIRVERDRDPEHQVDIDAMDDSEIDALLRIEGDEDPAREREDESTESSQAQPLYSTLQTTTVPETEVDGSSQKVESQLFGSLDDPARSSATAEPDALKNLKDQQPMSLETGLFGAATTGEVTSPRPTATPPIPTVVEEPQPQPMSEVDETIPNLADTITSLTELLNQTYTSNEPEVETFSAVPPGESLWAADETSVKPEPLSEQALDNPQLGERLAEDLQRFGGESEGDEPTAENEITPPTADSFEPSLESLDEDIEENEVTPATADSFEPPAELLGENLEAVDLEDLWSEHQEENPVSEAEEEENLALPGEIETDPWSEPASRGLLELRAEEGQDGDEHCPPQD
jgi:hypothetical protein